MKPRDLILYQLVLQIDAFGTSCRDGEHWTQVPGDPRQGNRRAWEFANMGVWYEPAVWRGEGSLTQDESRAFTAAVEELEAAGLVQRVRTGKRTTHLRPTPAGLAAGVRVIRREHGAGYPNLADVRLALGKAKWGGKLLEAAK
jgi:hypothetical protein